MTATFDTKTKRLTELRDADGHPAQMDYALADPANPSLPERAVQTVTIPNASSGGDKAVTTVAFDKRGNPSRAVDAAGIESRVGYGEAKLPDLPTKTVQVVGLPDESSW